MVERISHITGKSIVIQLLHFERPLEVSQNNKSDQLFFHIRMSTWSTKDGRFLPELVVEKKNITRQVLSPTEIEEMTKVAVAMTATTATVISVYTVVMFVL